MRCQWIPAAVAVLNLTACDLARDQASPSRVSIRGIPATIESLPSQDVFRARDALVGQLVVDAGLTQQPPLGSPDWAVVFRAGVYEVGRQCDMYLDALFRFGREQRAAQQGLSAVAGATGAILGLANAAASAIAITAASFGLAGSLFDSGVNSVLFSMEPSAVRNIVLQGRQAYLDSVDQSRILSRPDMLIYLQGYLTQCSPAAIEANVNNAANGSPYAVTLGDRDQRQAAARLAAPAVVLLQRARPIAGNEGSAVPIQQLPVGSRPVGWRQGDRPNVTETDVRRIQVALGVASASGALDPATRAAIREFQLGAQRRFGADVWPDTSGNLENNTWRTLRALGAPGPASPLRGPFERALLGDARASPAYTTLDQTRASVTRRLTRLLDSGITTEQLDALETRPDPDRERVALLREGIATARRRADPPQPVGSSDALDSALFDFVAGPRPAGGS